MNAKISTPSNPQEIIRFLKHAEARHRLVLAILLCALPPGWMAWPACSFIIQLQ